MIKIKVGKRDFAMIDSADLELVSKYNWHICLGYAVSNNSKIKMHRLIMAATDGQIVDHIDHNKLNNCRSNLRIVDTCGNVHNQHKRSNTANKYKGVNFIKKLGLYQARCRIYFGDHFLGYYKSEIAAAYAYNKKAAELSPYALLNELNMPVDELERLLVNDRSYILPAENKSKCKGVYWHKKSGRMKYGKWEAKIRVNGKYKSLGRFTNEQDAINALTLANRQF